MDKKIKQELIETLNNLFNQKFEEKFISLFTQGFQEVVLPEIEAIREEMATKKELDGVNSRLDTVERKLDRVVDQNMEQDAKIKALESKTAVV